MDACTNYNPPKVDANKTFAMGDESERVVSRFYLAHDAEVIKVDYKVKPYDLDVMKNGCLLTVEVKTFGENKPNATTIFAETFQNGTNSIPEYLTHSDEINRIIWFNRFTKIAYFFDCKRFAAYVNTHKKVEWSNTQKTGRGIFIQHDCKEAGFLFSRNLGAYTS